MVLLDTHEDKSAGPMTWEGNHNRIFSSHTFGAGSLNILTGE